MSHDGCDQGMKVKVPKYNPCDGANSWLTLHFPSVEEHKNLYYGEKLTLLELVTKRWIMSLMLEMVFEGSSIKRRILWLGM
jgi:hypothetical protein